MNITILVNGTAHIARQWPTLPAKKSSLAFTTIYQGVEAQAPGALTTGKSKAGEATGYTYFTAPDGRVFYVQGHLDQKNPITLPDDLNGKVVKLPPAVVVSLPPTPALAGVAKLKLKKGGKK